EVLPHIFEPFFSTKDKTEGVGLGLSVAFGIIQRHGGEIEVDSQVNQGTKFTITLPRRPVAENSGHQEKQHDERQAEAAGRHADRG
ncbi:MAG: two-component sensor histidine kinase, partial [Gammaproteobacteria bacterium]|nr:two-component sensor histidine kinase [Gammaproteobacteria bacterium]